MDIRNLSVDQLVVGGVVFLSVFLGFALLSLGISVLRQRRERARVLARVAGRAARPAKGRNSSDASISLVREEARDALSQFVQGLSLGRRLSAILAAGNNDISVGAFAVRMAVLGVVAGALAGVLMKSVVAALVGLAIGAYLPLMWAKRVAKKRLGKFEEAFPDAIDLLARALRAGHPFSAGLKMVADETSDPIRSEFKQLFEEQKFGMPVKESLQRFGERVGLLDVHIFVTAVLVGREVGGDLAEILGNISKTIRERFVIRRQVQTYTAQGRMTGFMLGGLPFVLGFVIYLLNPQNMMLFFTDPRGKALLGAALGMQFVGLMIIRKIIDIDV